MDRGDLVTGQEAPGPWELQRGFDRLGSEMTRGFADMNARLDRLVSTDAFTAEQRRVDEALATIREDVADEKKARAEAFVGERALRESGDRAQQISLDKLVANQKWIAISILLPIAFFLANIYLSRK